MLFVTAHRTGEHVILGLHITFTAHRHFNVRAAHGADKIRMRPLFHMVNGAAILFKGFPEHKETMGKIIIQLAMSLWA